MRDPLKDVPQEIMDRLLAFRRKGADGSEAMDMMGVVKFILEHSERYPSILQLVKVNEDAVIKHVQETGQPVPGVKVIKTTTAEGSNVTKVEIFQDTSGRKKDI